MTEERGEPNPTALIDYQGHEGRIIKLEEWRKSHEKVHSEQVATEAWVYRKAFLFIGTVGAVVATLAAALLRAIVGS